MHQQSHARLALIAVFAAVFLNAFAFAPQLAFAEEPFWTSKDVLDLIAEDEKMHPGRYLLQAYLEAHGGYGSTSSNLNVSPPFSVNGSGGVLGVAGGFNWLIPKTTIFVGPKVTALWGNMGGTTADPPASPGNAYTATTKSIVLFDVNIGTRLPLYYGSSPSGSSIWLPPIIYLFRAGVADVRTKVDCSCGATDTKTKSGIHFGGSVGWPIPKTPVTLMLNFDHIHLSSDPYNLPGHVPVDRDLNIITAGAQIKFSDVRLKRDIAPLGRLDNGLGLYRYRYVWSDQLYVGVMAQEVAQVIPEAVTRGADGYLRVNYAQLGFRMLTWEEWTTSH